MADTITMRISDRSHAILRSLSHRTGKSGVELIEEAVALMLEQEALNELRKANPASAAQALSAIYNAIAIRDPSVTSFYDTSEFARISTQVYRELAGAPTPEAEHG